VSSVDGGASDCLDPWPIDTKPKGDWIPCTEWAAFANVSLLNVTDDTLDLSVDKHQHAIVMVTFLQPLKSFGVHIEATAETPTPSDIPETTSPISGGETTPAAGAETTSPAGAETTPAAGAATTSPAAGAATTTAAGGGETTPAPGIETTPTPGIGGNQTGGNHTTVSPEIAYVDIQVRRNTSSAFCICICM
jgi:hypothetical protein